VYCKEQSNSSGNYLCNNVTGGKICQQHWFGQNCEVYCKEQSNSSGHYLCNIVTGGKT
jgi:hypothetical protein